MRLVEDWLKHNRPYALQIARHILSGNRDEAEDAVAEAALRAIRSAHTYNPTQPMRQWFCHIVTMACVVRFDWPRVKRVKKQANKIHITKYIYLISPKNPSGKRLYPPDKAESRLYLVGSPKSL